MKKTFTLYFLIYAFCVTAQTGMVNLTFSNFTQPNFNNAQVTVYQNGLMIGTWDGSTGVTFEANEGVTITADYENTGNVLGFNNFQFNSTDFGIDFDYNRDIGLPLLQGTVDNFDISIAVTPTSQGTVDLVVTATNLNAPVTNWNDARLLLKGANGVPYTSFITMDGMYMVEFPIGMDLTADYEGGAGVVGTNEFCIEGAGTNITNWCYSTDVITPALTTNTQLNIAIQNNVTLPIELEKFEAVKADNHNFLSWAAIELDASHYELERSTVDNNFDFVEKIKCKGVDEQLTYYNYRDYTGLDAYYRLKMVDLDGTYEYSSTIFVKGDSQFTVFPNPFTNALNIKGENVTDDSIVKITNNVGMIVYEGSPQNINTSDYPSGVYTLGIYASENQKTGTFKKIIKL